MFAEMSIQSLTACAENETETRRKRVEAMMALGGIYAEGSGAAAPNLGEAVKWWQKAAKMGEPNAFYNIGILYERLYLEASNPDKKIAFLTSAVSALKPISNPDYHMPAASFHLGLLCEDFARECLASKLMTPEERQKNAQAHLAQAATCYDLAARTESSKQQAFAGWGADAAASLRQHSADEPFSPAKLFTLRLVAARAGYPRAQIEVAAMYQAGHGVQRDLAAASAMIETAFAKISPSHSCFDHACKVREMIGIEMLREGCERPPSRRPASSAAAAAVIL